MRMYLNLPEKPTPSNDPDKDADTTEIAECSCAWTLTSSQSA